MALAQEIIKRAEFAKRLGARARGKPYSQPYINKLIGDGRVHGAALVGKKIAWPLAAEQVEATKDPARAPSDELSLAGAKVDLEPQPNAGNGRGQGPPDFRVERARKEKALADKHERENASAAGLLLARDDVERVWAERGAMVRDRLMSLPLELAAALALEPDEQAIEAILRTAIEEKLAVLADGHFGG